MYYSNAERNIINKISFSSYCGYGGVNIESILATPEYLYYLLRDNR